MATADAPTAVPAAADASGESEADAVRIPASARTLDGFVAWALSDEFPRRGRVSFLGGEIVIDMAAEEIQSHGKLKRRIGTALDNFVTAEDLGEVLPDGTLFRNEAAEVSHEPDLMVCTFDRLESQAVRYVEPQPGSGRQVVVEGRPDLVVEIVSRSSVRKDTVDLRDRYFRAGVEEYWVIDARGMRLSFLLLTRGPADWQESAPDEDGYRCSRVLDRRVRIERGTNRVGTAKYDLSLRKQRSENEEDR